MTATEKTLLATKLAADVRTYGVGLLRDAMVVGDDAAEPSVRVEFKDGLSFHLPFDFNIAHFDTLIAVACAAQVKGREEALLENLSSDRATH